MPSAGGDLREGARWSNARSRRLGGGAEAGRGDDLRRVLVADAEAADRRRADHDEDDVALPRRRPRGADLVTADRTFDERQPVDASRAAGSSAGGRVFPQNGRGAHDRRAGSAAAARAAAARAPRGRIQGGGAGRRRWTASAVDRVRIQHGAVDVTLGLDKASGLPHSVSFVGRGTRGRDRRLHDRPRRLPRRQRPAAAILGARDLQRCARSAPHAAVRHDCGQPPLDAALFEPAPAAEMKPLVALLFAIVVLGGVSSETSSPAVRGWPQWGGPDRNFVTAGGGPGDVVARGRAAEDLAASARRRLLVDRHRRRDALHALSRRR